MDSFAVGFCTIMLFMELISLVDTDTSIEATKKISAITPKILKANVKEITDKHIEKIDKYWSVIIAAVFHIIFNIWLGAADIKEVHHSVAVANTILPIILFFTLVKTKVEIVNLIREELNQ